MQMLRIWLVERRRYLTYPLVAAALALAVVVGACGDDDDSCAYEFTGVADVDECDDLAAEFDCNPNQTAYDPDSELCETFGCICADVDLDVDDDI